MFDPGGLPLGGLWVINGASRTSEFLNAFKRAVSYINDSKNATSVSVIVAEGFKKYFNAFLDLGSHEVSDMLTRGNMTFRYMDALAIQNKLKNLWQEFGIRLMPGFSSRARNSSLHRRNGCQGNRQGQVNYLPGRHSLQYARITDAELQAVVDER